jgi:hypothetical protein
VTPYTTTPHAIANACWYTAARLPETLSLPAPSRPYGYPEWAAWIEGAKAANACFNQFLDGGEFLAVLVTLQGQAYTFVCVDWQAGGFDRPALCPGHPATAGAALRLWLGDRAPAQFPADHPIRELFLSSAS